MTYELRFRKEALKEWRKLDGSVRAQFKKKLTAILDSPSIPAARLHGNRDRYKIKLRSAGYRLVYEVRNNELVVVVIAIGKRERNDVYMKADKRH
ncbi:type II toxin-antitoxin system RelE/ParE family toxin [Halomonas alkalicola]|jgi:mRNA interferase RelE/StbE|uniref:Type II toxin-antitoxin system RelE/ParE family toxin n=1 Tax=Halomonas alkalicola TaxID=1930622 RepID=A0ABY9H5G8_9GAMM|nr:MULTISPECIES: type II toxin-antitoxin system RelE/ParE family toxin [Halomonas]PWV71473.1 addiction module RelE/StbE family toxin [Halomonas sp. A11-A]QJQ99296.1 type II toxin-antitoxin system RelE/ParE family toxin [Halomonas sp. PGE1]WLI73727.1 type II toxin-antitoxin system RelE/ParE family toxin [Halomonas alkalicola]